MFANVAAQVSDCYSAPGCVAMEVALRARWVLTSRCIAGFCKQQLWPLFHYLLPLSPTSTCRFDPDLWQAYVKANKVRAWTFIWSQ